MNRLHPFFAQVYATCAILTFVATFLPLWSSPDVDSFDTMNLWAGATISNHGGEIAAMGLVLAIALFAILVGSALLTRSVPVLPVIAAVLSIPGLILLITKPSSSTPEPSLGTGGALMMALVILVILTAAAHVVTWAIAPVRNDERREQVTPLPAPPV